MELNFSAKEPGPIPASLETNMLASMEIVQKSPSSTQKRPISPRKSHTWALSLCKRERERTHTFIHWNKCAYIHGNSAPKPYLQRKRVLSLRKRATKEPYQSAKEPPKSPISLQKCLISSHRWQRALSLRSTATKKNPNPYLHPWPSAPCPMPYTLHPET